MCRQSLQSRCAGRVARLSFLAVALIAAAFGLLAVAAWIAHEVGARDIVGQFPLGADDNVPLLTVLLAAGAGDRGLLRRARRPARGSCDESAGSGSADSTAAVARTAPDAQPRPSHPYSGSSAVRLVERARVSAEACCRRTAPSRAPLRLTVLVPAYNEAFTIEATLALVWGQTSPPDRVVVVADNCTDRTAEVARGTARRCSPPRQHMKEGRRAEPGAVRDTRRPRPATW